MLTQLCPFCVREKACMRRLYGYRRRTALWVLHSILPEATRLSLGLQQRKKIAFAHGALDVANDRAILVVQELDAHLGDATARAGATDDLRHLCDLDGLLILF